MKLVRGKRQFPQERLFGFLLVTELRAGVRTFGFILGTRVWGFQWKLKTKKSNVAFVSSSRKSGPSTGSK